MSHELLRHPDVLKTIRFELLRGGYPKHEIEDGVSEVVTETFAYLQREAVQVDSPGRMCAIVRKPSYQRGIDALRATYTWKEYFTGAVENEDAHEAPAASSHDDRLEARRALQHVTKNSSEQEKAIIQGLVDGLSQKQIGQNLNLSHDQVRKATGSMRERHLSSLQKAGFSLGLVGVLVLLAMLFKSYLGQNQEAQKPEPAPQLTAPPAPPPQVPVATGPSESDKQQAAELRAVAHAAYMKKDWLKCSESYDASLKLDEAAVFHDEALSQEWKTCSEKALQMMEAKPR